MNKQQLAQKIMQLIDEEKRESIRYQMPTQWRTRGEVLSKIEVLCFREALREDDTQDQRSQEPDEDVSLKSAGVRHITPARIIVPGGSYLLGFDSMLNMSAEQLTELLRKHGLVVGTIIKMEKDQSRQKPNVAPAFPPDEEVQR